MSENIDFYHTAITLKWSIPLMLHQIKCTNIKMPILIKSWINLIIMLWHFTSLSCNLLSEKQAYKAFNKYLKVNSLSALFYLSELSNY